MRARCITYVICGLCVLFLPSRVFAAVVINEIFPNPSGSSQEPDEYIELYNTGSEPEDISFWKLDDIEDGGSNMYEIPGGTIVPPHSYMAFYRETTKVALNNSGDTVRVLNAEYSVVDEYTYTSTEEDVSYGRTEPGAGEFVLCQEITESELNVCNEPTPSPQPTDRPTNTPKPTHTKKPEPTKKTSGIHIQHTVPTLKSGKDVVKNTQYIYTPLYTENLAEDENATATASALGAGVLGSFHAFSSGADRLGSNNLSIQKEQNKVFYKYTAVALLILVIVLSGTAMIKSARVLINNVRKKYEIS